MSNRKHTQHIGAATLRRVQKYFPKVTKVNDATEPLIVHVTQRDVSTSKRMDHAECAMAVAGKRENRADGMIVARKTAYLIKGTVATRYTLPPSIQKEVVSFDRGSGFEVGEYRLSKPSHKLGKEGGGGPGGHARPGDTPKRYFHVTTNVRSSMGSDKVA